MPKLWQKAGFIYQKIGSYKKSDRLLPAIRSADP